MNHKHFVLALAVALTVISIGAFLWLPGLAGSAALGPGGDAVLAPSGCPPGARVSVDGPLCPSSLAVTGRVTGVACGDAAVTIRHTATCDWISDLLVGAGRTTANGAFTVPLSETLSYVHMGCSAESPLALVNVEVECPCGALRGEESVSGPASRTFVPPLIDLPGPGQTTISGQWISPCAGATLTVTDLRGAVIGRGLVQADGRFAIPLLRPLETHEVVHLTAADGDCRWCILNQGFASIGPIPVPEPSTLLLLAAGLAGLGGVVRARQRARSGLAGDRDD